MKKPTVEKTDSVRQVGDGMSGAELREILSVIMLTQATLIRVVSTLTKKDMQKQLFDYAKELETYSYKLMSVMEVDNDPHA